MEMRCLRAAEDSALTETESKPSSIGEGRRDAVVGCMVAGSCGKIEVVDRVASWSEWLKCSCSVWEREVGNERVGGKVAGR